MESSTFPIVVDTDTDAEWGPERALHLYGVDQWSDGFFVVNEAGHVSARPRRDAQIEIDVYDVVRELSKRGIGFPALIRFQDILESRVAHLNEAFRTAISSTGYENEYQGVYPVKVNQLREVVEEILEAGSRFGHGLECGSKSELVATLPYLADRDTLLLCNGTKDRDMVRLMLAGQRLGKRVLPILERAEELDIVLQEARFAEMTVSVGVRVRLTTRGAGLWSESGGENSKFGLSLTELVEMVRRMDDEGLPVRIDLLHFHLGSQIADLETVHEAVEEATRVYAWLRGRGVDVLYLDVGGGLGVSYEAGNPDALGTINYELEAYARTVVEACGRTCNQAGVPHPILVSESGRAVTAHHSILVVDVVGTRTKDVPVIGSREAVEHELLVDAYELYDRARQNESVLAMDELVDLFRRATHLRSRMTDRFRAGSMTVEEKAHFEHIYWSTCIAVNRGTNAHDPDDLPASLLDLRHQLVDHYQCNFSIFRSMVDYWAIGQRFPIMPLHRLDERPTRQGILVDLTCDSDGQVDRFVSSEGDRRYLDLHEFRSNEPYHLGLFLMGAYQDIMGDMHNLFGRVTEVHVYADEDEPENFYLEEILPGANIEQQLALVQYHANDLERRMGDLIRQEVTSGRIRPREGVRLLNQYRGMFHEMTYLRTATDD